MNTQRQQDLIRGAFLIAASEFVFVTMGAMVKGVSSGLSSELVVFFRNFFGLLALLPFVLRSGTSVLRTQALRFHFLRATVGVTAMYCFFYALAHLPLGNAMLLKQTAPLFIPVIAALWLSEHINGVARVAILVGFAGAALVLKPEAALDPAALVGLVGGFLAAGAKVSVRRLSHSETTLSVVFYFALIGTVVSAIPLPWIWQTPDLKEWALLLAMGPVASLGQILLTEGYSTAPAGLIGPFTYTSVVFSFGYGWLFWNEIPTGYTVAGAALIILAGVMVLRGGKAEQRVRTPAVR